MKSRLQGIDYDRDYSKEIGSTEKHQKLLKEFRLAVGHEFDDVVYVPYTNGMFRDFDSADRIIHAGMKGVPDCLILGSGWYLWFDGKTGSAGFTPEQTNWKERMKTLNHGNEIMHKLKSVQRGLDLITCHKTIYSAAYGKK